MAVTSNGESVAQRVKVTWPYFGLIAVPEAIDSGLAVLRRALCHRFWMLPTCSPQLLNAGEVG